MLEVMDKFPDMPMIRALYGNYWEIGGRPEADPKFTLPDRSNVAEKIASLDMISSDDESFRSGYIGRWLRDKFNQRSRFEC